MNATHDATLFISGLLTGGYAIAALYFLKFWRQTRDRLFVLFAIAFVLLTVQRVALALGSQWLGNTDWYYVLRLLAFALIMAAIIDKNRAVQR